MINKSKSWEEFLENMKSLDGYLLLTNNMKLTKENIKLLVNPGMNLTKTRKEIVGSLNCNLI